MNTLAISKSLHSVHCVLSKSSFTKIELQMSGVRLVQLGHGAPDGSLERKMYLGFYDILTECQNGHRASALIRWDELATLVEGHGELDRNFVNARRALKRMAQSA